MKANHGYSLVELMIAVAIVAIAIAIAVPSYSGYVQKTIVSNGINFAIEPQIEIAEKVRSGRPLPSNNYLFYENNSADAEISFVHWFSNLAHGSRIVVNYGPGAGARLKNKRLWFVLDDSNPRMVKWTCMSHPGAAFKIPIDALPENCR